MAYPLLLYIVQSNSAFNWKGKAELPNKGRMLYIYTYTHKYPYTYFIMHNKICSAFLLISIAIMYMWCIWNLQLTYRAASNKYSSHGHWNDWQEQIVFVLLVMTPDNKGKFCFHHILCPFLAHFISLKSQSNFKKLIKMHTHFCHSRLHIAHLSSTQKIEWFANHLIYQIQ